MTCNYTLLIGNDRQQVDLDERIGIALSKQYESLNNPSTYYTTWSKTVQIPFTANNNRIFDGLYRQDQAVTDLTIDPRKKVPFILFHNQEHIMTGYLKVNGIDNSEKSKRYNVTLYSVLGDLLNDMKLCTFDSTTATDPKYVLRNPLSYGCKIDRNIVKSCWEQEGHVLDINSKKDLDWIGFIPTYQGKYPDFDSSCFEQYDGTTKEFGNNMEYDEHYMSEFRSYYQQPYVWVDGLFQLIKEKIEDITDYKVYLDESWFNQQNPYWSEAILTCPSLYDRQDESGTNPKEVFQYQWNQYVGHTATNNDLSNNHKEFLHFTHGSGQRLMYNSRFRTPEKGSAKFKEHFLFTLFAWNPDPQLVNGYARLRDDNNLFLEFRAVDAYTNQYIPGARKRFMFYSNSTDITTGYDEAVDLGVSSRNNPVWVTSPDDNVCNEYNGYAWAGELDVEFNISWTNPYYIIVNQYARNNGDPFESAVGSWVPRWDWLWGDFYNGHYWYITNVSSSLEETAELRSNSRLTMDRVFAMEKTPFEYLLDYCKMFRLIFDLDEDAKELRIMTRDRYFSNYTIEDWSRKLDRSRDFTIKPINFDKKFFNFTYAEAKGQRHEYYQDKYKANYGAYKVDTGYDFNTDTNDLFTQLTPSMVTTKKQSTELFNTLHRDQPNFMGYNWKYLPDEYFVENDNEGSNAGNNGAFYFRTGRYPVDDYLRRRDENDNPYVWISDDTSHQIYNKKFCWTIAGRNMAVCNYFPAVSPYSGTYAFQFQKPKELYFNREVLDPPANTKYIYELFWKKYMDERYSVQTKVLTAYFYMTANDFLNFKFNRFVMVDNILYMVNKIYDFNLTQDKSVKLELVQVNDLDCYTNSGVTFPYLYTAAQHFNVRWDNISEVDVFSSSEWQIDDCSPWIWANKDGSKLQIRAYNINYGYDRLATITLSNLDGLEYTLTVNVEHQNTSLSVLRNNITFARTSGTERVGVFSEPKVVNVVSKPGWATVVLTQNSPFVSSTTLMRRSEADFNCDITVSTNPTSYNRSGTVVLTNGYDTVYISITQQGSVVITPDVPDIPIDIDDEPVTRLELVAGEAVNLLLDTYKEMKLNSLQITNGVTSTLNTEKIDRVGFVAQAEISEAHRTLGKTADGGIVKMQTVDGEMVVWNYNLGNSDVRHTVSIQSYNDEQGYVTVDSVDGNYIADVLDGTSITIKATSETGYLFDHWSDGNTNATRTLTVDGDIILVAYFVSNEITETVNATYSLTKCLSSNMNPTPLKGAMYTTTVSPFRWYTLDSVTVEMGGVNITSECYSDGVVTIPEVTDDITITATAGWGEYDYVWSSQENEGMLDFDKYNNGYDLEDCVRVGGFMDEGAWVVKEPWELPTATNIEFEALCGMVQMPDESNSRPQFDLYTTDSLGCYITYDQTTNTLISDIAGNIGYYNMGIVYDKVPQYLYFKNDNRDVYFKYGDTIALEGQVQHALNSEDCPMIYPTYQTEGVMLYMYAVRIKFRRSGYTYNTVNITANGSGSVQVDGVTGNYVTVLPDGTQLALNAVPSAGYEFTGWSDGVVNAQRTVTVSSNIALSANFNTLIPANNQMFYMTTDGMQLTLDATKFLDGNGNALSILTHTFTNGRYEVTFSGNLCELGTYTFSQCATLSEITLPDSLAVIGMYSFQWCTSLNKFVANYVTTYGDMLFYKCTALTSFDMPDTVTTLGTYMFQNCTNLKTVIMSPNITAMGGGTFAHCENLETVTNFPNLTTLSSRTFESCYKLKEFVCPSNTLTAGAFAFATCKSLQRLVFNDGLKTIQNYNAYQINLSVVKLPNSVETIGSYSFASNDKLTTVYIGSGLMSVATYGFGNCERLTEIYITANTAPTLGSNAFANIADKGTLHAPFGSDYSSWMLVLPANWTVKYDL